MNSIFKLRRINKNFRNVASSLIGYNVNEMKEDLKLKYINKLSSLNYHIKISD